LIVQNADGAPERGVAVLTIHSLLIRFVSKSEVLLRHVNTTKEIPGLTVSSVGLRRALQQRHSIIRVASLMAEPGQLLQRLWVVWILREGSVVRVHCRRNILFQLMYMADLVPGVCPSQWRRRRGCRDGTVEIIEAFVKLGLLLVNYADAKANFLGALKVRGDLQDSQERLQRVLQTSIPIIQKSDPVPQVRVLRIRQMAQSALISLIRLVKLVRHDIAMGEHCPRLTAVRVRGNSTPQKRDSLRVRFLLGQRGARLGHCLDVARVVG
jgi:hypothetical protein